MTSLAPAPDEHDNDGSYHRDDADADGDGDGGVRPVVPPMTASDPAPSASRTAREAPHRTGSASSQAQGEPVRSC